MTKTPPDLLLGAECSYGEPLAQTANLPCCLFKSRPWGAKPSLFWLLLFAAAVELPPPSLPPKTSLLPRPLRGPPAEAAGRNAILTLSGSFRHFR